MTDDAYWTQWDRAMKLRAIEAKYHPYIILHMVFVTLGLVPAFLSITGMEVLPKPWPGVFMMLGLGTLIAVHVLHKRDLRRAFGGSLWDPLTIFALTVPAAAIVLIGLSIARETLQVRVPDSLWLALLGVMTLTMIFAVTFVSFFMWKVSRRQPP